MLIPTVKAKWAVFVALLHRGASHVSAHTLTAIYLVVVAAVAIPVGDLVWSFWKPTVLAYHKRIAAPADQPTPAKRGKL